MPTPLSTRPSFSVATASSSSTIRGAICSRIGCGSRPVSWQALLAREFVPWFQSEHDLETGAVLGLEALVRWESPERGVIPASEFIDVAEEMGVAPQLSRMVLDRSLVAVRSGPTRAITRACG